MLNILLMIARNGPDIKIFEFLKAINIWKSDKKRFYL